MDFKELYKKVNELVKREDFESALILLRDTAHQILNWEKPPVSNQEIEYFLKVAYSTISYGVDYKRAPVWKDGMTDIAHEITLTGLQIIRKYDLQDLHTKILYVRVASSIEKNPEKERALDEEHSELIRKLIALEQGD